MVSPSHPQALQRSSEQCFPKPWIESLIVPIFQNGDKNNPSTIMINPLLSKLYGTILVNKINIWLESHIKRDKGQEKYRSYHSTINHLVIIV